MEDIKKKKDLKQTYRDEKNAMSKKKNTLDGMKNILDTKDKRISELQDIVTELFKTKHRKKNNF